MTLNLLYSILLITIIYYFYRWITKYFTLRKMLRNIPGPKSLPFIGLEWKIKNIPIEDRLNWFTELCFKFKDGIVLTWLGTEPIITIRKPHQIEIILPSTTLLTKSRAYDCLKPWLGNGLLTSTGEQWFRHRRLITPAFHFGILEEYAAVMSEKVQIFCECIEAKMRENPGGKINIFELAVNYTLDTICETAMGVNIDAQRNLTNSYVDALHKLARLTTDRFVNPLYKSDLVYFNTESGKKFLSFVEVTHNFTNKVIAQKKEERAQRKSADDEDIDEFGKRKRKAFLDILLDANESNEQPLTLQEIQQEVETFMFAGHDTTSATIAWILFQLGNAPDIQEKVHEELKEIFGNSDEVATTKQLGQLKYLDRVVKEALRLYPPAGRISRCLDADVTIDGHFIPKGTILAIQIHHLHRDPEVWKDPETFDPDRFLPENSQGRHPYAYIPFSAGPRNCIGQKFALLELKIAVTAILRKWQVRSVLKPSEVKMILHIIIRPHDEKVELFFTPINHAKS